LLLKKAKIVAKMREKLAFKFVARLNFYEFV